MQQQFDGYKQMNPNMSQKNLLGANAVMVVLIHSAYSTFSWSSVEEQKNPGWIKKAWAELLPLLEIWHNVTIFINNVSVSRLKSTLHHRFLTLICSPVIVEDSLPTNSVAKKRYRCHYLSNLCIHWMSSARFSSAMLF